MAKSLHYKDINRDHYETLDWVKDDVNDFIKNYKLINVETFKKVIRIWYTIE